MDDITIDDVLAELERVYGGAEDADVEGETTSEIADRLGLRNEATRCRITKWIKRGVMERVTVWRESVMTGQWGSRLGYRLTAKGKKELAEARKKGESHD